MSKEFFQRTIFIILGGILGLIIISILKDQTHVTTNKVIIVIIIAIVGALIGLVLRNFYGDKWK